MLIVEPHALEEVTELWEALLHVLHAFLLVFNEGGKTTIHELKRIDNLDGLVCWRWDDGECEELL